MMTCCPPPHVSPPQAAVLHLPTAALPAQRLPAGTHAAGEMEVQVAHHYR